MKFRRVCWDFMKVVTAMKLYCDTLLASSEICAAERGGKLKESKMS